MKKKFVNDKGEKIGTTGCRLSSVHCAEQLKDLSGRVGVASDIKPSIIPAKGGRKANDGTSCQQSSTRNPKKSGGGLEINSPQEDFIFVLNKYSEPLMPCSPAKAKKLLKNGRAKVVSKKVFTIKLLHGSSGYKQNVKGGNDPGSKVMAFAVITNGLTVYQSETTLRNNVHSKMEQRAMYRRNRRSRKVRYRKPRFDNRRRKGDWLTPTVVSKVASHLREKKLIESILPISSWDVEIGLFDITKINNPDVQGEEYQNGQQKDFYNTKAFVFWRDNYTCQICKGKEKDKRLRDHHIIFRKDGGTDDSENQVTLCETCHKKLHNGEVSYKKAKTKKPTKHATEISIVSAFLRKSGWIFKETFGYETKFKREQVLHLPKEHYNDAVAICCEEGEVVKSCSHVYYKKHVSKGDYQLCKGERGEKKIPVGKLFGLRKYDYIETEKGIGFVKGKRSSGQFALEDISGNKVTDSVNVKRNCQRIFARSTTLIEKIRKNNDPISSHK